MLDRERLLVALGAAHQLGLAHQRVESGTTASRAHSRGAKCSSFSASVQLARRLADLGLDRLDALGAAARQRAARHHLLGGVVELAQQRRLPAVPHVRARRRGCRTPSAPAAAAAARAIAPGRRRSRWSWDPSSRAGRRSPTWRGGSAPARPRFRSRPRSGRAAGRAAWRRRRPAPNDRRRGPWRCRAAAPRDRAPAATGSCERFRPTADGLP